MSQLPAIFEHTDQLLLYQATLGRRQEAQNLLHESLVLEAQFEHWLGTLTNYRDQHKPMSYWAEDMPPTSGGIPFSYAYCFSDSMTGTMFLYFWMAHILFYKNTESLNRMIFEPVIDTYPDIWPDLPPALQVGQSKYQQTREFADSICRGLDSALEGSTQPDILIAPLTIALDLYKEINATSSQDGLLEIMWLEAFRGRLIEKGQYVTSVVQGNRWVEVAMF
jgi:(R)-2-hydroxyglutarate---pyruvate transhydrogenase